MNKKMKKNEWKCKRMNEKLIKRCFNEWKTWIKADITMEKMKKII
jgi:hypothetical protein